MQSRLIGFGEIEIGGQRYDHDLVIDAGRVRKRKKGPSRPRKVQYGHTPLTAGEDLPWGGLRLIIGTGVYGALPITQDVQEEARRRGVELIIEKTEEACRLIAEIGEDAEVNAVLHLTC